MPRGQMLDAERIFSFAFFFLAAFVWGSHEHHASLNSPYGRT